MIRCLCCDLPIESCGKQAEVRQRAERAASRAVLIQHGWFEAQYPGKCATCSTWFAAGDLIRRDPTQLSWQGECCAG